MMRLLLGSTLLLLALECTAQQTVEYRVTFSGSWVAADSSSYPSSAHFTELVGATHAAGHAIWKRGELASLGVKDVAELGSSFNIEAELGDAAQAGTTGPTIILASLFNLPNSTSKAITVELDKPNITLISMLAPSSDWFVGVSGLPLRQNGQWRQSIDVDLHPYDAGTENGNTFSLSNPATSPPAPIQLIGASPFFLAKPVVGRLKFELLTKIEPSPSPTPNDLAPSNIAPVVQLLLSD